jgi:hypothetical protein
MYVDYLRIIKNQNYGNPLLTEQKHSIRIAITNVQAVAQKFAEKPDFVLCAGAFNLLEK